jgi:hypothetical protein
MRLNSGEAHRPVAFGTDKGIGRLVSQIADRLGARRWKNPNIAHA